MYKSFDDIKKDCLACTKCELCRTRTNVVFGAGREDAKILIIGEGPGENEDLQGLPFVGRGGQLLDKMLLAVDLDRNKNIYIANMVKCRPPKNRDPKPEEVACCLDWLRNQVLLMKPKIIVCLGRIASARLIKEDIKITKEHGQFFEKNGVLMMPMLHPAAILRDPRRKPEAFEDFLTLREKIKEICDHTYTE